MNELETVLREMWAEVLSVPSEGIGVHDNFFELNGDSVAGILLCSCIEDALITPFTINELNENQTIASMAEYIRGKKAFARA